MPALKLVAAKMQVFQISCWVLHPILKIMRTNMMPDAASVIGVSKLFIS